MKSTILTRVTGTALFAVLAMPTHMIAQGEPEHKRERFPHYRVIDLGTLGGIGTNSAVYDMNNAGWAAGSSNLTAGGPQHAFLWYGRGHLKDLGTLGGSACPNCNSEAGGPNARGEAAIISETSRKAPLGEDFCGFDTHLQCLGAIWKDGRLTALPTLGGYNAQALGLNNHGEVVGWAETKFKEEKGDCATPFQRFDFEAVIWGPNGEKQKLDPLPGDTVGFALGINDHGQAVGASGLCSNVILPLRQPNAPHAVLWESDGSPKDLGSLGGTNNIATSINNRGEVVGGSQSSDGTIHPFLWTKETGIHDLGAFPGAVATLAPCCNTINDRGEVVGFSIDANFNMRAFVWKDNVLMDLNGLIPKHSPWYLQAAQSLNDAGQIAVYGTIHGETHAFLATPCHRHGNGGECCEAHDR
jgi:probable HAF family extracellular repeat protein